MCGAASHLFPRFLKKYIDEAEDKSVPRSESCNGLRNLARYPKFADFQKICLRGPRRALPLAHAETHPHSPACDSQPCMHSAFASCATIEP